MSPPLPPELFGDDAAGGSQLEPGSPQFPPPHACCELAAVPLLLPKKFPLGSLGEICAQAQLLTTARPPLAPGVGLHGGGWGLLHGTPPPEHPWAGETPGGRIWGQDLGAAARGLQEGSKAPPAARTSERSPKKLPGRGGGDKKGGKRAKRRRRRGKGRKVLRPLPCQLSVCCHSAAEFSFKLS